MELQLYSAQKHARQRAKKVRMNSKDSRGLDRKLIAMLIFFFISNASLAEFGFGLSAILDTQGVAQEVRIGDVTGDGLNDIVLVNNGFSGGSYANHVLIYQGFPGGGILAPESLAYSTHPGEDRGLVLVNTDDDDALEIVIGHGTELSVLNQDLNSVFFVQTLATAFRNDVLDVSDVNLDGQKDLVSVQNSGRNAAAIVYSLPDFLPLLELDLTGKGSGFVVDVNDVNDDGIEDLLIQNQMSSAFSDFYVYAHNGIDAFSPPVAYSVGVNNEITTGLTTGDFNSDGLNDVFVSESLASNAYLYLQNGFAQLELSSQPLVESSAFKVQSSDLNADGLFDVALLHDRSDGSASFGYMLQDATGLGEEQLFNLPLPFIYSPTSLTLGDINQDDCTDVAITDVFQGLIILYGKECRSSADLSVEIRSRGGHIYIIGSHLEGSDVESARMDVVIRTLFPVRIINEGCRLVSNDRTTYRFSCNIQQMNESESVGYLFTIDESQIPGQLSGTSIYAAISSELPDDNLSNNEKKIRLR